MRRARVSRGGRPAARGARRRLAIERRTLPASHPRVMELERLLAGVTARPGL
jgi:hypothetical protein